MATIRKHPRADSWQVRYRDPANKQRSKNFATRTAAKRFAAAVETDKRRGEYIDPQTGTAVDQNHAGSSALLTQGLGCRDCHTVSSLETFNPPNTGGFNAGAMETLVPQRGGVNTQTPIPPQ